MASKNIETFDFKLILDDTNFNKQIAADMEIAEQLNTSLSNFLAIKSKVSTTQIKVDTRESVNSLEELNEYFRKLEEADWSKIGESLDVTPYVERMMAQLRQLEEEIEVIQSLRLEAPDSSELAEAYKIATQQANNLVRAINEIRKAEATLNTNDGFRAYIESIGRVDLEYQRLVEHLKKEEEESRRIQKEKEKEAALREKVAAAAKKEAETQARKQMQGEFEEYVKSLTECNEELEQMNEYYRELEASDPFSETNNSLREQSRLLKGITNLAATYFSLASAKRLVSDMVRVSSEFEYQKTTLRAILNDVQGADAIFEQIKSLAVVSPFNFRELVSYTKQLSAYNIPIQELYSTTKMLADVSAGLGVGMDRLVLAYGQVRSAEFLRGQEVRQFTEAGIPILDELRKQFVAMGEEGITVADVFDKISQRLVPFSMVEQVFKNMTSEGGKFFNMQAIQADTLKGKISNLKDAYEIMLSEMGEQTNGIMVTVVDTLRDMIGNWEDLANKVKVAIVTFGVARVALALYTKESLLATAANTKLGKSFIAVGKWMMKNPYTVLAAGAAYAAIKIYDSCKQVEAFSDISKSATGSINNFTVELEKEIRDLDILYKKLAQATEGSKDFNDTKDYIFDKYDAYIEQLRKEGVEVENQTALYDGLRKKIEEATKAKYRDTLFNSVETQYTQAISSIMSEMQHAFREYETDFSAEQEKAIWRVISGVKALGEEIDIPFYAGKQKYKGGDWGSVSTSNINTVVSELTKKYEQVTDDYNKARGMLEDTLGLAEGTSISKIAKDTDWFNKIIRDLVGGTKFAQLLAKEGQSVSEYIEGIRKRYADVSKEYEEVLKLYNKYYQEFAEIYKDTDIDKLNQIDTLEGEDFISSLANSLQALGAELDKIEIISQELGFSLNVDDDKTAQKNIEGQIELIKKLQDAYEQLKDYVEKEDMPNILKNIYGDAGATDAMVKNLDFREQLMALAEQLAKFDKEASDKLKIYLGNEAKKDMIEQVKELAKARKTLMDANKTFEEYMKSWLPSEGLEGSGGIYKINKVISDYRKELEQINKKRDDAVNKLNAERDAREAVIRQEAALKNMSKEEIDALVEQAKATEDVFSANKDAAIATKENTAQQAALAKALAKTTDASKALFDDWAQKNGLNLSDWSHKSMKELKDIQKQLSEFGQDAIPEELRESLVSLGIDITLLEDKLTELYNEANNQANYKMQEKRLQAIKKILSEIASLGDKITEIGDITGNLNLQALGNSISAMLPMVQQMVDQIKNGDYIGAGVTAVSSMVTKILEAVTAEEKLKQAIIEARREQSLYNLELEISRGTDGWFGEDKYAKFRNAYQQYTSIYEKAAEDIAKINEKLWGGRGNDSKGLAFLIGGASGAALGATAGIAGGVFAPLFAAAGALIGFIVGGVAGAITDVSMLADNYQKSIQEMADELGASLIDFETGLLNKETLTRILNTYDNLDKESKEYIQSMISNLESFETVVTEVAEFFGEVFGDVVSSVADSFVQAFKESGKAALDYADIMDEVATNIAKSMIQSVLLQSVFDDDRAKEAAKYLASGQTGKSMEIIEQAMQSAQELAPYIQQVLESLQPYMQMGDTQSSSNVADGIQSITENTADLLASYINAMRADLSAVRSLNYDRNNQLELLIGLLPNAPKLADYLATIQATTYDISTATHQILSDLDAVMTDESGRWAIRTYM